MPRSDEVCAFCGGVMPEGYGWACPSCSAPKTRWRSDYNKGDVVQFTENHKWRGCLGIITENKKRGKDNRLMVAVQVPESGIAYIYTMESDMDIEYVGRAILEPLTSEKEE